MDEFARTYSYWKRFMMGVCKALECGDPCGDGKVFCDAHWARIPHYLRAQLIEHATPGMFGPGNMPAPEWGLAAIRAINHLARSEGLVTAKEADYRESRVQAAIDAHRANRQEK